MCVRNVGVDQVSVDAEKGIVTVVGVVDPVCVTKQVRKTGKNVEVISVGTPKKPDDPKPPAPKDTPLPSCCPQCQVVVAYGFESYDDSGRLCTIL